MTTTPRLPEGWRENPALALEVRDTLRAAKAERVPRREFATPGALAAALDPTTRQTPALDIIDRTLVDVEAGRLNRAIISMPPQEGKSERTTHYGALWMLHRNPNLRIGIVSYGERIARRFSMKIRNDIAVFNGRGGNVDLNLYLRRDSKAAGEWLLAHPHRGSMYATGIGGALTGQPVDVLFIDDPVKDFAAAESEFQSAAAWDWWDAVARPRLAPGAPVILIQTRWHELDLAGRLIAKQKADEEAGVDPSSVDYDAWTVVNIPAQADHDPEKGQTDPLGRQPGEFMLSARGRTVAQWEATKLASGSRTWNALYQGRPSPDTGNVWKRQWWRRYRELLWTAAPDGSYSIECDELIMSWDMTFKDTKSSDYVVGQVWARRGAMVYLVEQIRRRLSFTDTITALLAMRKRWPQARTILIEDKANGPAVISTLRTKVGGIIPVEPNGSKISRANAVAPYIESGNVHLPTEAVIVGETDPEALIDEAAAFPNGAHDDMVDATSQALDRLFVEGAGASAWIEYLNRKVAQQQAGGDAGAAEPASGDDGTPPEPELTPEEIRRAARTAQLREQR